jgi:hypothetical protein
MFFVILSFCKFEKLNYFLIINGLRTGPDYKNDLISTHGSDSSQIFGHELLGGSPPGLFHPGQDVVVIRPSDR